MGFSAISLYSCLKSSPEQTIKQPWTKSQIAFATTSIALAALLTAAGILALLAGQGINLKSLQFLSKVPVGVAATMAAVGGAWLFTDSIVSTVKSCLKKPEDSGHSPANSNPVSPRPPETGHVEDEVNADDFKYFRNVRVKGNRSKRKTLIAERDVLELFKEKAPKSPRPLPRPQGNPHPSKKPVVPTLPVTGQAPPPPPPPPKIEPTQQTKALLPQKGSQQHAGMNEVSSLSLKDILGSVNIKEKREVGDPLPPAPDLNTIIVEIRDHLSTILGGHEILRLYLKSKLEQSTIEPPKTNWRESADLTYENDAWDNVSISIAELPERYLGYLGRLINYIFDGNLSDQTRRAHIQKVIDQTYVMDNQLNDLREESKEAKQSSAMALKKADEAAFAQREAELTEKNRLSIKNALTFQEYPKDPEYNLTQFTSKNLTTVQKEVIKAKGFDLVGLEGSAREFAKVEADHCTPDELGQLQAKTKHFKDAIAAMIRDCNVKASSLFA